MSNQDAVSQSPTEPAVPDERTILDGRTATRNACRAKSYAHDPLSLSHPRLSRTDMTDSLTDRQQEVARLVAQGYTNKQIGACLSIQAVTVRVHISAIVRVWQLDQSLDARVQIADRMKAALTKRFASGWNAVHM